MLFDCFLSQQLPPALTLLLMTLPTAASSSAWSPRSPKEACTSSPPGIRYSHLANVGNVPCVPCLVFFTPLFTCLFSEDWNTKQTFVTFNFILCCLSSCSVKLVVFTVFYGDHLISYWTAEVYSSHCCNGTSSAFFGSECHVVLCVRHIKNDGCDVCVILTCLSAQSPPDSHLVTAGTRASSVLQVIHVTGRIRCRPALVPGSTRSVRRPMGLVALAHTLPPSTLNEVRMESQMFVFRVNMDLQVIYCENR